MSIEKPCTECAMPVRLGEYHPYAACLMFKGCSDAKTVRANLNALTCEWQAIGIRHQQNKVRRACGPY